MAAQQSKSALAAKLNARMGQAVEMYAGDTTTLGSSRVPPGITNGIAKLTTCTIEENDGKNNPDLKGEFQYRAVGVCVEPESVVVNGQVVSCTGCQTSEIIMLCDQWVDPKDKFKGYRDERTGELAKQHPPIRRHPFIKDETTGELAELTQDFQIRQAMIRIRSLAIGRHGEDFTASAKTGADMLTMCEMLEQESNDPATPIYFRFSTTLSEPYEKHHITGKPIIDPNTGKPKPRIGKDGKPMEPRVFENWHGSKGLGNYRPPVYSSNSTVDNTTLPTGPTSSYGAADKFPDGSKEKQVITSGEVGKMPDEIAGATAVEPTPEEDTPEGVLIAAGIDINDLDVLAQLADAEDDNANIILSDKAIAAGITEEELDLIPLPWANVVAAIRAKTTPPAPHKKKRVKR